MTRRWTDGCNYLPFHFTGIGHGNDVERRGAIGQLCTELFHDTDQRGAGLVGSQVFLKRQQNSLW